MDLSCLFNSSKPYRPLYEYFCRAGSQIQPFKTLVIEKDQDLFRVLSVGRQIASVAADNTITVECEGIDDPETIEHVAWLGLSRLTQGYYSPKLNTSITAHWYLHLGFHSHPLVIRQGFPLSDHGYASLLDQATSQLTHLTARLPDTPNDFCFRYEYGGAVSCAVDDRALSSDAEWLHVAQTLKADFAAYPGDASVLIQLKYLTEHERMLLAVKDLKHPKCLAYKRLYGV